MIDIEELKARLLDSAENWLNEVDTRREAVEAIEQLQRENAELKLALEDCRVLDVELNILDRIKDDEIAELRRDLEEARRDAERYQWLREKSAGQWDHPIVVTQRRTGDHMTYTGPLIFDALDSMIDAARQPQG